MRRIWRGVRNALVLSLLLLQGEVLGTTACDIGAGYDPACSQLGGSCGFLSGGCCSGLTCNCDWPDGDGGTACICVNTR